MRQSRCSELQSGHNSPSTSDQLMLAGGMLADVHSAGFIQHSSACLVRTPRQSSFRAPHRHARDTYGITSQFIPYTCRLDAAYRRFCSTTAHLLQFTGKLVEATAQALTCDLYSQREGSQLQAQQSHARFLDTLIHLGSLLHAVALARLRDDCNMENITVRLCWFAVEFFPNLR